MIRYGCIVLVGIVIFAGMIARAGLGGPDKIGTGIDVSFGLVFLIATIGILLLREFIIEHRPMPNPELPNSSEVYKLQVAQQVSSEREFTNGLIFAPIIVIVFLVIMVGLLYLITKNPAVDQAIDAPRIINEWRSFVGAPPYVEP